MSLPDAVLECPHCNEAGKHRIHSYGDGTAVVWCGSCHNPREMLLARLHAKVPPVPREAAE
jgi:transcription elongation factor Elf1